MKHPAYSYALLLDPDRVLRHLEGARRAGVIEERPNVWQLCLGAIRLWHRIVFRFDTIGTSSGPPRRPGLRPRLFEPRPLRLPFLLAAKAVAPWDLTGLYSSPERITRHLLGSHHDKNQFVFDLQLLAAHPGRLEELVERTEAVVDGTDPSAQYLRDLVVFEGYHETLLDAARAAVAGDFRLTVAEANDPDLSLTGLVRWCALAPETPAATWAAMRSGAFALDGKEAQHARAIA